MKKFKGLNVPEVNTYFEQNIEYQCAKRLHGKDCEIIECETCVFNDIDKFTEWLKTQSKRQ